MPRPAAREPATKRWRESVIFWCIVVTAIATLALLWLAQKGTGTATPSTVKTAPPEGLVSIAQAYVRNGQEDSYTGTDQAPTQTLASSPTVELVVNNESSKRILVTAARVKIEAYSELHLCFSQGAGPAPVANPKSVRLPDVPLPSQKPIEDDLTNEVGPDESEGIPVRVNSQRNAYGDYGVYKINIKLLVFGKAAPLDAGSYVLSTPSELPRYGAYLPESNRFLAQFEHNPEFRAALLSVTWCMRKNISNLAAILKNSDKRATTLELMEHPYIAPKWATIQDHTPARASATRLLAQKESQLAAFAARLTGDQVFERRIDTAAAEQLLLQAEHELNSETPTAYGEAKVREALLIDRSQQGQTLLAEFQRRLHDASLHQ
jgi:hypothetical protein